MYGMWELHRAVLMSSSIQVSIFRLDVFNKCIYSGVRFYAFKSIYLYFWIPWLQSFFNKLGKKDVCMTCVQLSSDCYVKVKQVSKRKDNIPSNVLSFTASDLIMLVPTCNIKDTLYLACASSSLQKPSGRAFNYYLMLISQDLKLIIWSFRDKRACF